MNTYRPREEWERSIVAAMLTAMPKRCPVVGDSRLFREIGAAYQHMDLRAEARTWYGWADTRETTELAARAALAKAGLA